MYIFNRRKSKKLILGDRFHSRKGWTVGYELNNYEKLFVPAAFVDFVDSVGDALAAETVRIYVTNRGGTTIDVIDPKTNKVVHVIKSFVSPEGARFSPDGNWI